MAIRETTDTKFSKEVESADAGTVLVDFWAPWCGPCKRLNPVLEEVNKAIGSKVSIIKLNVDENPQSAENHGVMGIPALILFQNGKVRAKSTGLQSKEQLVNWINENL
ncbi:thioredoxin [Pasteuria penetrans]|uniref:thioredoxin n=1 Tax=Pasteuria penetrans TaxID=86005 RepID=UPI000FA99CD5|nr:thioredoxin [Pasteuria penetrans]